MQQITFNPSVHPSYKTQFDKLTSAYIRGEVDPWDCKACFVGNLLNGQGDWVYVRNDWIIGKMNKNHDDINKGSKIIEQQSGGFYTPEEMVLLEDTFLGYSYLSSSDPEAENKLFKAFSTTLDLLKQLHESKGEVIDETPVFVKRGCLTVKM